MKTQESSSQATTQDQRNQSRSAASAASHNSNLTDLNRFLKAVKNDERLAKLEKSHFRQIWLPIWDTAHQNNLPGHILKSLLTVLARLPSSSNLPGPPLAHVLKPVSAFASHLDSVEEKEEKFDGVGILCRVVQRLFQFTWKSSDGDVQLQLSRCLTEQITPVLARYLFDANGKSLLERIKQLVQELESPFCIKSVCNEALTSQVSIPSTDDQHAFKRPWENQKLQWLLDGEHFAPSQVPVMRDRFDSGEHYLDSVADLWIAVTFCDGWKTLSPRCQNK